MDGGPQRAECVSHGNVCIKIWIQETWDPKHPLMEFVGSYLWTLIRLNSNLEKYFIDWGPLKFDRKVMDTTLTLDLIFSYLGPIM